MRIYLLFFSLVLLFNTAFSQEQIKRCHSTEIHEEHYESNEDYKHWYDASKVQLNEQMEISALEGRLDCTTPIIIPLAVHYEGVGNQNLGCLRDLALGQIESLNKDYAAINSDIGNYEDATNSTGLDINALAAEGVCVQFCLADLDHPSGFGLNDGDYAITINQNYVANGTFPNFTNGVWAGYLNVFVTEGTGVLGYSPLNGGGNGSGVVIEACAFGIQGSGCGGGVGPGSGCTGLSVYNLGRTITHEIGHYLGLDHIWGPGNGSVPNNCNSDDGFNDTPNCEGEKFGCPNVGVESCGSVDMHMNYMDYVNDACMYMFSEQQANLMRGIASGIWGIESSKCTSMVTQNDASIASIVFPENESCSGDISPIVRLRNIGEFNLTSVTISYSITGGGSNTFDWTGSLGQNEFETVTLPSIAGSTTAYTITAATSNPNGVTDDNAANDSKSEDISILNGASLPFTEDVENFSAFPDQGIIIDNPDEDEYAWTRRPGVSAYGDGVYAIYFDNFSAENGAGTEDWFILPELNVTNFNSVNLTFDISYTYYAESPTVSRFDSLELVYSLGCSNVWQSLWLDGGMTMATINPLDVSFLPTADDWENKTTGTNTLGNDYIRFAFINKSGRGNGLYLDNINLMGSGNTIATNDIESLNHFNISPNPANSYINLNVQFNKLMDFEIVVHDVVGREMYTLNESNTDFYRDAINLSALSDGIYFISIIAENEIVTKKVLLSK